MFKSPPKRKLFLFLHECIQLCRKRKKKEKWSIFIGWNILYLGTLVVAMTIYDCNC
ncbi:hypothetical protein BDB01DRAFT_804788, partial [Pilobolus umbonatus]